MFPFFRYTTCNCPTHFSLFFFFTCVPLLLATTDYIPNHSSESDSAAKFITDANDTWRGLLRFLDAGKGAPVPDLKRYFRRFGYLSPANNSSLSTSDDIFDDEFEKALVLYQRKLGLSQTGALDRDTMRAIVSPRCGVQDLDLDLGSLIKTTRRYAYFYGRPRWAGPGGTLRTLTYGFSPQNMIDYVSPADIRAVFGRAFASWAAVIPVNFKEVEYSSADIKIGWYRGDHGDGEAFDGVLGVLGHAFSPQNGRFHLDGAERWAVDLRAEKSKVAVDLESVATHEIGHVLGLGHSSVKEAIMYPSLSPRTKKVKLHSDDEDGIIQLYGANPNYRSEARAASDTSSSAPPLAPAPIRRRSGQGLGLVGLLLINWRSSRLLLFLLLLLLLLLVSPQQLLS